MKKSILVTLVLAAVVVFALGSFSTVSAYSAAPASNDSESDFGFGGRGGRMGGNNSGVLDGFLHDEMLQAFADKLGVSVEDLETRLANGETMSSIALSQGLTLDQFDALMDEARDAAIDQAVSDGLLTQTQADTMKETGPMRSFGAAGTRGTDGTRAARGTGLCLGQ